MHRIRLISLQEPGAWAEALQGLPHSYWHSWTACMAASFGSKTPCRLFVWELGAQRVVCPIVERRWKGALDVVTPVGFSGFASNSDALPLPLVDDWRRFLNSRNIVAAYVGMHPELSPKWTHGGDFAGKTQFLIDLDMPESTWLSHIDSNRRRSIRSWERKRHEYVLDRNALADFVLREHQPFMRSVNASPASFFPDEALRFLFAQDNIHMVGARDAEGVCAAAVYGVSLYGAELLFHISVRQGREFAAALMWWGRNRFSAMGLGHLNLGGGIHDGDALFEAKRRYRPSEKVLTVVKQVIDEAAYVRLCNQANVDAHNHEGYFPAYRASADAVPDSSFPNVEI
jgi:hypothetical protein